MSMVMTGHIVSHKRQIYILYNLTYTYAAHGDPYLDIRDVEQVINENLKTQKSLKIVS